MPDGRTCQPFANGVAATVRLDDDIDRVDSIQVAGITIFSIVRSAGDADSGNAVKPQRVAVRLALDERHLPRLARILDAVKAIQERPRSGPPPKAISVERNAYASYAGKWVMTV